MGMYTGIQIDVLLREDTPMAVLEALRYMTLIDQRPDTTFVRPDDPLFKCDRWSSVLCGQSAYFPECEDAQSLVEERLKGLPNGKYQLRAAASLKNYGGEIGHFLKWIANYIDESDQSNEVGWYRYEETRNRTHFSFLDGKVLERREKIEKEDWEG